MKQVYPVIGTIIGAFFLSGLGLFIMPQKRKKAIREFKHNFDKLRDDIIKVLEHHINDEITEMVKIIEAQFQQADDHFTDLKSRTLNLTKVIAKKRDELELLRTDIIKQIEKTYDLKNNKVEVDKVAVNPKTAVTEQIVSEKDESVNVDDMQPDFKPEIKTDELQNDKDSTVT